MSEAYRVVGKHIIEFYSKYRKNRLKLLERDNLTIKSDLIICVGS